MKRVGPLVEKFFTDKLTINNSDYVVVKKTNTQIPVLATTKWELVDNKSGLKKTFVFRTHEQKCEFIKELLEWENDLGHHAKIDIEDKSVNLLVKTENVGIVTEIDKEYADFADVLYKQVVYNPKRLAL